MAKTSTSITSESRKNMPSRGRSKQTLILESIKERALLELTSEATKEDVEKAIFGFMAEAAFNPTQDTAMMASSCLGMLMKKGWPDVKSVMPCVEFEFDENSTHAVQAAQILKATADGQLPPDMAATFIQAISNMLKIDEMTDLRNDVEEIKRILNESRN